MNQLESLKKTTTIVADSGDIESIRLYKTHSATTNPTIILNSANLSVYQTHLENALSYARKHNGSHKNQIINASDKLAVNIGVEILNNIPGRISTEIDVRLSFDSDLCIKKAHKLINLYQESNIDKSRILIKLASTWEGIKAAKELEKEKINCNLTLLFSLTQAKACAEANIYIISPFIGRICDWHQQQKKTNTDIIHEDPGVKLVHTIYNYFKKYHYKTAIMGASFRKIEQILKLSGCDYLTIAPDLLKILYNNNQPVECKLFPPVTILEKPKPMSESEFRWKHNQNDMAVHLLAEGIRRFAIDQEKLDNLLAKKL